MSCSWYSDFQGQSRLSLWTLCSQPPYVSKIRASAFSVLAVCRRQTVELLSLYNRESFPHNTSLLLVWVNLTRSMSPVNTTMQIQGPIGIQEIDADWLRRFRRSVFRSHRIVAYRRGENKANITEKLDQQIVKTEAWSGLGGLTQCKLKRKGFCLQIPYCPCARTGLAMAYKRIWPCDWVRDG